MTAPIKPAASSLYGKDNWFFVPTVASAALIPTAVEVNAAGSLDVTDMLFADWTMPGQTTNRVARERRYGDTVVAETIGALNLTGGTLHYAFDPQAAAGSNGKKAFEKFGGTSGTTGYLVRRRGIAKATTPAAADFVNCYKVTIGPAGDGDAGQGEAAESGMVQEFTVDDRAINVQLT